MAALTRGDPLATVSLTRYIQLAVLSSRRDLKRAFRLLWGASIRKSRCAVRLNCAYADPLRAEPGRVTVRKVARRQGFRRTALFSRQYYRRFGEWPGDALRWKPWG